MFFLYKALSPLLTLISFIILSTSGLAQSVEPTMQQSLEKTMIVLDGSGSMWGQIDGVPKLEIARKTLREMLKNVPENMELGLIAYGHREKGNCTDIELIVPPKAGTASLIADRVDGLKFLGKTPLSAAVQLAAKELNFTEDKASVILITDGLETCNADPCSLGKTLNEQGVNFTAHVIGFGLSKEEGKQVACLSENTGGKYFSANNADALIDALKSVVAVNPEVSFIAIDQNENELKTKQLNWLILDLDGNKIFQRTSRENISAPLLPGSYEIIVEGVNIAGTHSFTIKEQSEETERVIFVPVEVKAIAPATLKAPARVAAGKKFEVSWTGPNAKLDYVAILKIGAVQRRRISYAYTQNGNPARLRAPKEAGTYELRYVLNSLDKTLFNMTIIVE